MTYRRCSRINRPPAPDPTRSLVSRPHHTRARLRPWACRLALRPLHRPPVRLVAGTNQQDWPQRAAGAQFHPPVDHTGHPSRHRRPHRRPQSLPAAPSCDPWLPIPAPVIIAVIALATGLSLPVVPAMISRQRLRLQSRQHPSLPSRHPWLHGSVPLIISAILSAIAVLFLSTSPIMAGYPASQAPAVVIPASPSPLPPSAAAASTGDLIPPAAQPLVFRADLQPAFSIPVYTCQAGILARFAVQPGDRVAAGDTLAWLDDRLLRLEDQGAQATQSQAQLQYNRFRTAWERGMISAQELEQSAQALRLTELRRAQTSQALARTVLLAPVAGQVAEYQLYSGQPLPAAQECFRITDPIDLAAELSIPAVLLPRVRLGQTASARLEDTPSTQTLTGCVVRLSPVVDPASGGSLATVRFPSAGRFLRPGLAVHVRLQEE